MTLLLFFSCSSSRLDRKIKNKLFDALADETYMRWEASRFDNNHDLSTSCYHGDRDDTLRKLQLVYDQKHENPLYWVHLGNCYFLKEDWAKADFFYRLSLEESKDVSVEAVSLNNLGLLQFKYDAWDKGKELLQKAIKLSPESKVPKFNLAQLFIQFGFYDKAIALLTSSVFMNHQDVDIDFSLGNAFFFSGDLEKAKFYFKKIPKSELSREDIAATYSLYLLKLGDVGQANFIMKRRMRSHLPQVTAIAQKIEKIILQRSKEE